MANYLDNAGESNKVERETVADIGEKRLISAIVKPIFGTRPGAAELGIGDDAAVLTFKSGDSVVVSTDKIPENLIALELGLMTPWEHGRYLAVVNVSDIIAMAAYPKALLLTLCVPSDFNLEYLIGFLNGFKAGADEYQAAVVGGDTGWSSVPLFSATAIGTVKRGQAVLRSGAKPGDRVVVTGPVGGFGAALSYFLHARPAGKTLDPLVEDQLRAVLVRPNARLDMVGWTAGYATAAMDITDGLGQSLIELAEASACRIVIDSGQLPLHPAVESVARLLNVDPLHMAFGIGLDLEILATVAEGAVEHSGVTEIGRCESGSGVCFADSSPIPGSRWEHFKSSAVSMVAGVQE